MSYQGNTTIAAISTPLFKSGVGVLRVSGDRAIEISEEIFKSATPLGKLEGNTCIYGKVYSKSGEFLDEAVATVFRAPKSYTGEDTVELSCHGSPTILKRILRALLDSGATLASGGEFTKRALLNGKLSLTQAEAVIDIIEADSSLAAKCAFSNRRGALYQSLRSVCNELISLEGHISALVDFPEEDLLDIPKEEISLRLNKALSELMRLKDTFYKGKLISSGIPVAIVGRPNAGKSSLMNALSGVQKSIVTEIEGTTRDVVEETICLESVNLILSDTAGIRETDDVVEKIGVERAKEAIDSSALVLCVFDGNKNLSPEDMLVIENTRNTPRIAVINKEDLELKIEKDVIEKEFEHIVFISASRKTGLDRLEKAILEISDIESFDESMGVIANERQFEAISRAIESLSEACRLDKIGETGDIVMMNVEDSIGALLALTGEKASQKVVDDVFSRFCVGK